MCSSLDALLHGKLWYKVTVLRVPPQEGLLLQQLSVSCLPIFKSLYMLHCSLALGALIGGGLNQGHMTNPFPFLSFVWVYAIWEEVRSINGLSVGARKTVNVTVTFNSFFFFFSFTWLRIKMWNYRLFSCPARQHQFQMKLDDYTINHNILSKEKVLRVEIRLCGDQSSHPVWNPASPVTFWMYLK